MGNRGVRIGVTALLATAGVALGTATTAAAPQTAAAPPAAAPVRACPAPDVDHVGAYVQAVPTGRAGFPSSLGRSIAQPAPPAVLDDGYDMDADGAVDTVAVTPNQVAITRADGTVTLTAGPSGYAPASSADLDGDGRDELWGTFRTQGQNGRTATVVVPGTTAVGSHLMADVALVFDGVVVGDVTGDERNDAQVEVPFPIWTTEIAVTHWSSMVGALDATGGRPEIPADAARLSSWADLDLDGQVDRAYQWLGHDDGGPDGSAVVLSGAPDPISLAVGDTTTYASVLPRRSGTGTYLATDHDLPWVDQHQLFQVTGACARAWLGRAVHWVLDEFPASLDHLGGIDPATDLSAGRRRSLATTLVRSVEARTELVDHRFQQALHRDADPGASTHWVRALRSGRRSPQHLTANLFASNEFYVAHGSTLAGWVNGLYQQGAGYAPDPAGAAYWAGQALRLGRERTALRFFATPGIRRALVAAYYPGVWVMGRPVDPSGLERGVRLLGSGGWDAFQIELLASDEFYLKAQQSHRLVPG